MKIEVDENGELLLSELFNGIGIKTTDQGVFGLALRDGGLEILQDGRIIWTTAKIANYDHVENVNTLAQYLEEHFVEHTEKRKEKGETPVQVAIGLLDQLLPAREAMKDPGGG